MAKKKSAIRKAFETVEGWVGMKPAAAKTAKKTSAKKKAAKKPAVKKAGQKKR